MLRESHDICQNGHARESDARTAELVAGAPVSDALVPRSAGFPAITITARNAMDYAPHWHQPTDTPDRIDLESLNRTYDFCCALLERLDESVGAELA